MHAPQRLPRRRAILSRPAPAIGPVLAVAVALALGATLAACGDDTEETPTTEPVPVTAESLDGRTFVSTAVVGWFDLVEGTTIRLTFEGDQVSANAGCNTLSGPFRIDGATLVLRELVTTEIGCEEALMTQDSRIGDLLGGDPVLTLEGEVLALSTGSVSITFLDREVADPDRPLESTTWTLTGIISGDAVSSVPSGVVATLSISDGTALVAAGCNTGSAPVTIGDGTLEFGPLALTKMACEQPAMEVEAAVASVLAGTAAFTIDADQLTITSTAPSDGAATGLQFAVVAG